MAEQTVLDPQFAGVMGGMKAGPIIPSPEFSGPDSSIFRPGNVTLCSIIPREFTKYIMHASYTAEDQGKPAGAWQMKARTTYRLPKPEPGGYSTITVYDGVVLVPQYEAMATSTSPTPFSPRPVHARAIAETLYESWGGNIYGSSPDCMPGIGIIRGTVPTQDELDNLIAKHLAWCRKLVQEADLAADAKQTGAIGPQHHDALGYLKEERDWHKGYIPMKACFICDRVIPAATISCPSCGPLPRLALDYGWTVDDVPDRTPKLLDRMRALITIAKMAPQGPGPQMPVARKV